MTTRKIKTIILITAAMLLLLSGCGPEERVFDAGAFRLSGVVLDGEELNAGAVYPQGGSLLLCSDGTGVLALGEDAAEILWSGEADSYSFRIHDLTASGSRTDGLLRIEIEELGVSLLFTEGETGMTPGAPGNLPEESTAQKLWGGSWTGRMWFENPEGEWADYEWRTMAVSARVILEEDSGGVIQLWQDFYSKDSPMAEIRFEIGETKNRAVSGYMMSYPVAEWSVGIVLDQELPSEIEDTIIMHPDIFEYGHYYNSDPAETESEETPVNVLRLTGSCGDGDGSFSYKIILTRE